MTREQLRSWKQRWQLIELWAPPISDEIDEVSSLSTAMARLLSQPAKPEDVFRELLGRGWYSSAHDWLLDQTVTALVRDSERQTWADSLSRAVKVERAQLLVKCGALEVRASRLLVPHEVIADRLRESLDAVSTSRHSAEQSLAAVRSVIDEAGLANTDRLRQRLAATFDESKMADLSSRVMRYVDSGELDLANWMLDNLIEPTAEYCELPPPRPLWPFQDDAVTTCQWFLGRRGAPLGFSERWGLKPGDQDAIRMIESLAAILVSDATASDVSKFVFSLERFLDCSAADPPEVKQLRNGLFMSGIRGLDASELPAFGRLAEVGALPLCIGFNESTLGEVDLPSAPTILLTNVRSALRRAELSLDVTVLFRLVRSDDRRIDFLREIGAQVPLALALPEEIPLASEERLLTRFEHLQKISDSAPLTFICGARGVGKTAFIGAAIKHFVGIGKAARLLQPPAVELELTLDAAVAAIEDVLDDLRAPDAKVVIVADWSRQLPAEVSKDSVISFARYLLTAFTRNEGLAKIVMTIPAPWAHYLDSRPESIDLVRLDPLTWSECRTTVSRLLDVLGIPPAGVLLIDRLVYYSAGWPQLLFRMLRESISTHARQNRNRRAALSEESIEVAWRSNEMTETGREIFLRDVGTSGAASLALGILLQLADLKNFSSVSMSDLEAWWQLYAAVDGETSLRDGVQRLSNCGLLLYDHDRSAISFRSSSVHQLLLRIVGDLDSYCDMASELVSRQV